MTYCIKFIPEREYKVGKLMGTKWGRNLVLLIITVFLGSLWAESNSYARKRYSQPTRGKRVGENEVIKYGRLLRENSTHSGPINFTVCYAHEDPKCAQPNAKASSKNGYGKVVVYEGMLKKCGRNHSCLQATLAHEVAHVQAKHTEGPSEGLEQRRMVTDWVREEMGEKNYEQATSEFDKEQGRRAPVVDRQGQRIISDEAQRSYTNHFLKDRKERPVSIGNPERTLRKHDPSSTEYQAGHRYYDPKTRKNFGPAKNMDDLYLHKKTGQYYDKKDVVPNKKGSKRHRHLSRTEYDKFTPKKGAKPYEGAANMNNGDRLTALGEKHYRAEVQHEKEADMHAALLLDKAGMDPKAVERNPDNFGNAKLGEKYTYTDKHGHEHEKRNPHAHKHDRKKFGKEAIRDLAKQKKSGLRESEYFEEQDLDNLAKQTGQDPQKLRDRMNSDPYDRTEQERNPSSDPSLAAGASGAGPSGALKRAVAQTKATGQAESLSQQARSELADAQMILEQEQDKLNEIVADRQGVEDRINVLQKEIKQAQAQRQPWGHLENELQQKTTELEDLNLDYVAQSNVVERETQHRDAKAMGAQQAERNSQNEQQLNRQALDAAESEVEEGYVQQ